MIGPVECPRLSQPAESLAFRAVLPHEIEHGLSNRTLPAHHEANARPAVRGVMHGWLSGKIPKGPRMAVHWGGRGPGHMSRKSITGRTWADFTAATGFVESPDNTFTRNTANSWTPRVTSNTAFTGAVQMEGVWTSGADSCFGLDNNRAVSQPFNCQYGWYFSPTAGTRLIGVARVAVGVPSAGDIYGIRKFWNGTDWTIEWYRIRSGTTTVHDSLTTAVDDTLGVLYGAFLNTASSSLSGASV